MMVDIASSLPSLFSASNRLFSKHPDAAWIDASSTSLKLYNLIFGLRPDSQEILLGYKKRGMHCGLWNGFGGKVEPGESAEGAAIREFWEESGLLVQPGNLKHVGVIFNASQGRAVNTYIDVFVVNEDQCEGQPKETEEMRPSWYSYKELLEPIDRQTGSHSFESAKLLPTSILPELKDYLPFLLSGKRFACRIDFDPKDDSTGETPQERSKRMRKMEIALLPPLDRS